MKTPQPVLPYLFTTQFFTNYAIIGSNTSSIKSNDSEKLKNLEEDLKGVELNQPPPIATRPEKTKSIYTAPVDEEESDPNALKVPNLAKETISENSTNTGNLFWFWHIFCCINWTSHLC